MFSLGSARLLASSTFLSQPNDIHNWLRSWQSEWLRLLDGHQTWPCDSFINVSHGAQPGKVSVGHLHDGKASGGNQVVDFLVDATTPANPRADGLIRFCQA